MQREKIKLVHILDITWYTIVLILSIVFTERLLVELVIDDTSISPIRPYMDKIMISKIIASIYFLIRDCNIVNFNHSISHDISYNLSYIVHYFFKAYYIK